VSDLSGQPALPRRVSIDEDVAWQKVDGRVVMLVLGSERYYRLDDVGSRMWELLEESADVHTAHTRLHAEYDADPSTLRRDLHDFIVRLAEAGILHVEAASP
jgi:coenzyme PQQ synthesis protein D (PqqD)